MSIIKVPMDTGFFQISNQAVSDFMEDGSNWNALALLCYLASKPDYWEVSYEGIRAQTGASREKIAKSLGALQDYGYARKMRKRTENGTLQGTQWEVCGKPIFTTIVRKTELRVIQRSVHHSSENQNTVKPRQVKKVVSKEGLKEKEKDSCASGDARFDEFWTAYPNKKGKAKAQDHWKRLRLDSKADDIIAHVMHMRRQQDWLKDGGKFIPHGSSYVSRRLWEDGIPGNAKMAGNTNYGGLYS